MGRRRLLWASPISCFGVVGFSLCPVARDTLIITNDRGGCIAITVTEKPGPDPTADRESILEALVLAYSPVLGTSDIAERTGVSRQAVDQRLRRMEEDGLVDTRKIGRARVWWITNKGRTYLDPEEDSGIQ
ncbi:winged helix-turn-helix transcriptional regulator [Haloarcula sp. JP-Z28]|nr:winged helix-turn-helix transcriptional regulator [Haloarcula sp. JP-Z28]